MKIIDSTPTVDALTVWTFRRDKKTSIYGPEAARVRLQKTGPGECAVELVKGYTTTHARLDVRAARGLLDALAALVPVLEAEHAERNAPPVSEPAAPLLTCHKCRHQQAKRGPCEACDAPADYVYL